MSRARLEMELKLTELLIALAEDSAVAQRAVAEGGGLQGEALARALISLAVIESSAASRKAERQRILAALSALPSPTA